MSKYLVLVVLTAVISIAQASSENLANTDKTAVMPACPTHQEAVPAPTGLEFDQRAPGGARPVEMEKGQRYPLLVDPSTVTIFPRPTQPPTTTKEKKVENLTNCQ